MSDKETFSPFLRLYKYRPKPKHTPKENFVTEAFALCLYYNDKITRLFLKEFLNIETTGKITLDTQVPYKDAIFDLTISDTSIYHVSIECKMGAKISKQINSDLDQLDRYINHLKEYREGSKHLLLIDVGKVEENKNNPDVFYKAIRWNEVKLFFESQKTESEIGELFRLSFIDLLRHLKVDRKLINGKLAWRCELCEAETIGQGIYSHRRKHERDTNYRKVIDEINSKMMTSFEKEIFPYLEIIREMREKINAFEKIEKNNFVDRLKITTMMEEKLPKTVWVHFINQIQYCFSNKAFLDYTNEISLKLKTENIKILVSPLLINHSYENLVKYRTQ